MGTKQQGDPSLEGSGRTGTHQPDQPQQDTLVPSAKDEPLQQSNRASASLSTSSNYQIREMKQGSDLSTRCSEVLDRTHQQGIPDESLIWKFRPFEHDQPPDDSNAHLEPGLDANSEQTWLVTAQEQEIIKALAQLRQDSLDRMAAIENLQVPNFDEFAQAQCRARESMARIRSIGMSQDRETTKGKQVVVPGEYLTGQEHGSTPGTTRQRRDSERDSGQKTIEVQRTWVALMEEREIAKALDQLSKENLGRGTSRSCL